MLTPPPSSASSPRVLVTTADEAGAIDRAAIAAGVPSRALMQRAGAAAAAEIVRRHADRLVSGVHVFAGPGNNGGDAWVVAGALARWGVRVAVTQLGDAPRTEDARFERERALGDVGTLPPSGRERLVVDGVFGTGGRRSTGEPPEALRHIRALRAEGAAVVALDVPSGLDATTGEAGPDCVTADLTLTFGTLKRGLLVGRAWAGDIAVLDIGLGPDDLAAAGRAITMAVGAGAVPAIDAAAHKGVRGRVAIVGGARGMAGATMLAAEAALRSGAGLVRVVGAPESVPAVQTALPEVLAAPWPNDDAAADAMVGEWAHAVLLGPGLSTSDEARALCERVLRRFRGPVVLDADALNVFAGRLDALRALLAGRPSVLTPHPAECARLLGTTVDDVLARRFEIAGELARATSAATVLLKGVPTVVSDDASDVRVVAAGTPALATGGSGDVLGGILAALAGHSASLAGPDDGAACAPALVAAGAWVHGRAGELATARRGGVRGTALRDVLASLSDAWPRDGVHAPRPPHPVLLELPAVPA